jgi:ABC-type multidrug transport system ATPase subunit
MFLEATNLGKKFRQEWIFHNFSYQFQKAKPVAIIGGNGSGKTTLLKILSGILSPTQGNIDYQLEGQHIDKEHIYQQIAWAAPYIELIEEFTLSEMIRFYKKMKGLIIEEVEILDKLAFIHRSHHKLIKQFSSGMKQKLKLVLAFYSPSEILLLDEPTSNLDKENSNWYLQEIQEIVPKKLLIISSNQPDEYDFCTEIINIKEFKPTF